MFSKKTLGKGTGEDSTIEEKPVARPTAQSKLTEQVSTSQRQGKVTMGPSIIGTDLAITGNIISKGEIQVEGEISGDIHCSSLIVGPQAQVNGGVRAEDVVVHGKVMGSVHGLRVSLQSSSYVEGDIYHQSLSIEQGAFFEGKSRRTEDPLSLTPAHQANVTPLKQSASK